MDLEGSNNWHRLVTAPSVGEAGNGFAFSDAMGQLKDCFNALKLERGPIAVRTSVVARSNTVIAIASEIIGQGEDAGEVPTYTAERDGRVLVVGLLHYFTVDASFPAFLLLDAGANTIGQGFGISTTLHSSLVFAVGDLVEGVEYSPRITHPGIGGTMTFSGNGFGAIALIVFPAEGV